MGLPWWRHNTYEHNLNKLKYHVNFFFICEITVMCQGAVYGTKLFIVQYILVSMHAAIFWAKLRMFLYCMNLDSSVCLFRILEYKIILAMVNRVYVFLVVIWSNYFGCHLLCLIINISCFLFILFVPMSFRLYWVFLIKGHCHFSSLYTFVNWTWHEPSLDKCDSSFFQLKGYFII